MQAQIRIEEGVTYIQRKAQSGTAKYTENQTDRQTDRGKEVLRKTRHKMLRGHWPSFMTSDRSRLHEVEHHTLNSCSSSSDSQHPHRLLPSDTTSCHGDHQP